MGQDWTGEDNTRQPTVEVEVEVEERPPAPDRVLSVPRTRQIRGWRVVEGEDCGLLR